MDPNIDYVGLIGFYVDLGFFLRRLVAGFFSFLLLLLAYRVIMWVVCWHFGMEYFIWSWDLDLGVSRESYVCRVKAAFG